MKVLAVMGSVFEREGVVERGGVILEDMEMGVLLGGDGDGEVISDGEVLAVKRSGKEGEGVLLGGDGGEE